MNNQCFVYGWNFDEWAIAVARIGGNPQKLGDFANVKYQWETKYPHRPGEVQIAGVDVERDYSAVERLSEVASTKIMRFD